VAGTIIACGVAGATWYYVTPKYTKVGYQPVQPVPFPHDIHVTQLGMDCRYCHSFVEVAAHSNLPNTQTCMNCHSQVQKENPKLEPVRASWKSGQPISWVQIHRTPDYVFFNHSIHVNRGISCFSCHGPVNRMSVVYDAQPLSMAWCLGCHRHPENFLRPDNQVFNLDWKTSDVKPAEFVAKYGQPKEATGDWSKKKKLTQREIGQTLKEKWNIKPPTNCQGCHR
jgi:hypothetical protein